MYCYRACRYPYWVRIGGGSKVKKVAKLIGLSIILLILIFISTLIDQKQSSFAVVNKVLTLFIGAWFPKLIRYSVDLVDNDNWKASQRKLERAGILKKNTIIRISFAYLFRIKVDGKYFLVPNTRSHKYQPVGGAYKFCNEEAQYLSNSMSVENDDRVPVNKTTQNDYRLLVKNKHLRDFVKRFDITEHRENGSNLSREFEEEIFSTGILTKKSFGSNLSYRYCGRHMTDIQYGSIFKHFELLLADIFEVQLSEKQEELFRTLMEEKSDKYYFATSDEIKSFGVSTVTNKFTDTIATHTPKIITENTEKLGKREKSSPQIEVSLN